MLSEAKRRSGAHERRHGSFPVQFVGLRAAHHQSAAGRAGRRRHPVARHHPRRGAADDVVRRSGRCAAGGRAARIGLALAHSRDHRNLVGEHRKYLMNDLFDTQTGLDSNTYPRALYAPHPVLSGLVSRRTLLVAIGLVNLADLAILIVLTWARGWPVVAFALSGFILSVAYTAPPVRLKKRGLGEPDVFVVWGPLMVCGTYYSAVGHVGWNVLLASLPYGLLCTTVLMGKHIDKIPYDEPLGIHTLPVIFGEARARVVTLAMMVGFYLLVVAAVLAKAMPWPALIVVLALPRLVKVWPYFRRPPPDEPPANFPVWPLWYAALAWVHVRLAGALLVLGLAIAALLQSDLLGYLGAFSHVYWQM